MRLLTVSLFLFISPVLLAGVIGVPDDQETIQAAIQAAQEGDTVLVEDGQYIENLDFSGKLITVASYFILDGDESHIRNTIIDGGQEDRCIRFSSHETEESILVGFTIRNGEANYGAGIYCFDTTPRLQHLVIVGNNALRNGGALYATSNAHPSLLNVTIVKNSAQVDGGAIRTYSDGTVTIVNGIIWSNDPPELQDELTITFSDIEDGYDGQGNIDEDPDFIDLDGINLDLAEDSPCIDTGDPDSPRSPDGSRADMGALSYSHQPRIVLDPPALDFDGVHIERTSDLTLDIRNDGLLPLVIESITIVPEQSPFSIVAGNDINQIEPEGRHELTIRFAPVDIDTFDVELQIVSNDPDNNLIAVVLSGVGEPKAPAIIVPTDFINFGNAVIRVQYDLDLPVFNIGDDTLHIDSLRINGNDAQLFTAGLLDDSILPDDSTTVYISYTPAHLGAEIAAMTIYSDDTTNPAIDITLNGSGSLPDPHFNPVANTGVNHSILITSALFDDRPLDIANEIAVFTEDGLCAGSVMWMQDTIGFPVWGDNELTDELDGFVAEEPFDFRYWDFVQQREFIAIPEFTHGDTLWTPNGISVITLDYQTVQIPGYTIFMHAGWNLISAPIVSNIRNVVNLWRPIVVRDHLFILKDYNGDFYYPQRNFITLPDWDYRQGYQAKLLAVDSLFVPGDFVEVDSPIPLEHGWSMVAYYPPFNLPPFTAFENVLDDLRIAKDGAGNFCYPARGFNNMAPLSRGNGYLVNMLDDVELVWNVPEFRGRSSLPTHQATTESHHYPAPLPTPDNMSLLVYMDSGLSEHLANKSCDIGVFTSKGLCCGSAKLELDSGPWGIPVWGDDPTTESIEGAMNGEELKIYAAMDGKDFSAALNWLEGYPVYNSNDISVVELSAINLTSVPIHFKLNHAYPNPFNGTTAISFEIPSIDRAVISVYSMDGRLVSTVTDAVYAPGRYSLAWQAEDLSSGIYFIRMFVTGQNFTTKAVLVR